MDGDLKKICHNLDNMELWLSLYELRRRLMPQCIRMQHASADKLSYPDISPK